MVTGEITILALNVATEEMDAKQKDKAEDSVTIKVIDVPKTHSDVCS